VILIKAPNPGVWHRQPVLIAASSARWSNWLVGGVERLQAACTARVSVIDDALLQMLGCRMLRILRRPSLTASLTLTNHVSLSTAHYVSLLMSAIHANALNYSLAIR
jgi:hypothetical protein